MFTAKNYELVRRQKSVPAATLLKVDKKPSGTVS